jgi:transcriptional regulator with XRE-family HTH domain
MPSVEAAAERCAVVEGCALSFVLIGERLREWREVRKLSECDLERTSGISRLQTARFEDGLAIPDIETLRVYARVLKIPVAVLLYGDDAPQTSGVWRGLSEFTEMFSLLNRGERNLLRTTAMRIRPDRCHRDQTVFGVPGVCSSLAG